VSGTGPQLEDGYLRIANEVWNQLMMCQFNREQRGIIDLIIRLSWGCGKKWAHIPRQKDFCLAGVYESHVKRELEWLEKANVITVDRKQKMYQFNKHYDTWRVSIGRGYDEDELAHLVALNLQISKKNLLISKNDGEETYKEVSSDLQRSKKNLLISKSEDENLLISKTKLTYKEDPRPANPHGDGVRVAPKDNSKDNNTTTVVVEDDNLLISKMPAPETAETFWESNSAHLLNPTQYNAIQNYRDDGFGDDVICAAMERTLLAGKDLRYAFGILNNWRGKGIYTLEAVEREERVYRERAPASSDVPEYARIDYIPAPKGGD
jgi:DnaD/phage-associated family protein